jgi:prepilin-type processing-associated H-X9-DG protein
MSNMKQMGLAEVQYSQDYDQVFTGADLYNPASFTQPMVSWMEMLYPYTKAAGIYLCPSTVASMSKMLTYSPYDAANIDVYGAINRNGGITYAYNVMHYYTPFGVTGSSLKMSSGDAIGSIQNSYYGGGIADRFIQQPDSTIMLADVNSIASNALAAPISNKAWNNAFTEYALYDVTDADVQAQTEFSAGYTCGGLVATWHNGGYNAVYYDGHAKWKQTSKAYEWFINKQTAIAKGFKP